MYNYELAPHLIKLMIEESHFKLHDVYDGDLHNILGSRFYPEISCCSFYIGRQVGCTTALYKIVDEYIELGYSVIVFSSTRHDHDSKICKADFRRARLVKEETFRGENLENTLIFFDSQPQKLVNRVCKLFHSNPYSIVSVGEL